ncbi:MAG: co-chaperone GroES [Arcobacter butzleri]|jgi:chaperonin GroES|nr:co-chaperone GroES [Arcobacteraceae bacterium]MDY0365367.1 co-chaperone GroES [Arcobacteraceae bacterium]NLO17202.1 co-chaperone GroES [Aliarcobacter butzleri]
MNFQPLGERVLVKRVEEENKTASGIIIPDNAKEKPQRGEVVAISSKIEEIAVGNKVVFGKYSGTEISIDGVDYLVLEEKDILGVIK